MSKPKKPEPFDPIRPKNSNQERVFGEFQQGKNLILSGCAGTGKTFLLCYLAIRDLMMNKSCSHIKIIRSAVSTRDVGHLPGTMEEKMAVYWAPYKEIFKKLQGQRSFCDTMMNQKVVSFESTSFLRGTTIDDSIVIVDEYQNMTFHELDTIITRIGENTRIFFAGDGDQSDLKRNDQEHFFDLLHATGLFSEISFTHRDIVRSGLVKEYITQKYLLTNKNR